MRPGPDPYHTEPLPTVARPKKRKRLPKPSFARVGVELVAVLAGLFAVVTLIPLSSRWFLFASGTACVIASAYAVYGAARLPGAAKWWGFTWGGRYEDDLAIGLWNSGLLFVIALVPVVVVKNLVVTPKVPYPVAYLVWCFVQDFLFFSLILRGFERLLAGKLVGHKHLSVFVTAALFGLSHHPLYGFMGVTALIAVCWGYIFLRTRLLWPVTASHFLLGLMVMM